MELLFFIPACFALNMTPGPNNLMALNNGRCFGFRAALVAGMGRIIAFAGMITLTASGLAIILYASEALFLAIKVIGALYLFWIAVGLWRSKASLVSTEITPASQWQLLRQEFFLAAGNPKAILIFTAFFPQFVDPLKSISQQFVILGATFLVLEIITISIYALAGLYLRHWFAKPQMSKLFNRSCAALLALSSANLAMIQR
ncbi:transporter LysE family [Vibrio ponticus]|nr:transporter LysE family [Vibrio ponticus]